MHNHRSIGLLRKMDFGGNFGFWVFWPLPFLFFFLFSFLFFSLVRRGARADTKIWLVTKNVITSCIPQVQGTFWLLVLRRWLLQTQRFSWLLLLILSFCFRQFCTFVQTLSGPRNLFRIFFLSFFFIFFFCFSTIFDWLAFFLSFFFSLLLDYIYNPR